MRAASFLLPLVVVRYMRRVELNLSFSHAQAKESENNRKNLATQPGTKSQNYTNVCHDFCSLFSDTRALLCAQLNKSRYHLAPFFLSFLGKNGGRKERKKVFGLPHKSSCPARLSLRLPRLQFPCLSSFPLRFNLDQFPCLWLLLSVLRTFCHQLAKLLAPL